MRKMALRLVLPLLGITALVGSGFATWYFGEYPVISNDATVTIDKDSQTYNTGTFVVPSAVTLNLEQKTKLISSEGIESNYKGAYLSVGEKDNAEASFDFTSADVIDTNKKTALVTTKVTVPNAIANYVEFTNSKNNTLVSKETGESAVVYTYNWVVSTTTVKDKKVTFNILNEILPSYIENKEPTTENDLNEMVTAIGESKINFNYSVKFVDIPTSVSQLTNGDFESGNLNNWTVIPSDSQAFMDSGVVSSNTRFWASETKSGRLFYGHGSYLFNGESLTELAVGELHSEVFSLTEDYISYKLGGKNENGYVELVDAITDKAFEDYRWTNQYFKDPEFSLNLVQNIKNVSALKNRYVYINVVDNSTKGFGFVTLDDFRVNQTVENMTSLIEEVKAINYEESAEYSGGTSNDKANYEALYENLSI